MKMTYRIGLACSVIVLLIALAVRDMNATPPTLTVVNPLDFMPDKVAAILHIDVEGVFNSKLAKEWMAAMPDEAKGFEKMKAMFGIDQSQIRKITLGLASDGDQFNLVIVLQMNGPLILAENDPDLGAKNVVMTKAGQYDVYVREDPTDRFAVPTAFAKVGNFTMIGGTKKGILAVLRQPTSQLSANMKHAITKVEPNAKATLVMDLAGFSGRMLGELREDIEREFDLDGILQDVIGGITFNLSTTDEMVINLSGSVSVDTKPLFEKFKKQGNRRRRSPDDYEFDGSFKGGPTYDDFKGDFKSDYKEPPTKDAAKDVIKGGAVSKTNLVPAYTDQQRTQMLLANFEAIATEYEVRTCMLVPGSTESPEASMTTALKAIASTDMTQRMLLNVGNDFLTRDKDRHVTGVVDAWGHPVWYMPFNNHDNGGTTKLPHHGKSIEAPWLFVASAGPDGEWGTYDKDGPADAAARDNLHSFDQ